MNNQILIVSDINPCQSNFDQTVQFYEVPTSWLKKHMPDTGVTQCAGFLLDTPFYDHKLDFNHVGEFTTPHDVHYWFEYALKQEQVMAYCNEYYPNHKENLDNIAMTGYMYWLEQFLQTSCVVGWTNIMW